MVERVAILAGAHAAMNINGLSAYNGFNSFMDNDMRKGKGLDCI